MAEVAAAHDMPVVVMHNQSCSYYKEDIMSSMKNFFQHSLQVADEAGLRRENIIFDPGIGFGKTAEQNLEVLGRLHEMKRIDGEEYPLLLGTSRKSFIGRVLNLPVEERMEATGATCVAGIMQGVSIVRVHDVKPIARMCRMTDAILAKRER